MTWAHIPPPPHRRPTRLVVPWALTVVPLARAAHLVEIPGSGGPLRLTVVTAVLLGVLLVALRHLVGVPDVDHPGEGGLAANGSRLTAGGALVLVVGGAGIGLALLRLWGSVNGPRVAPIALTAALLWAAGTGAVAVPVKRLADVRLLRPSLVPLGVAAVSLLRQAGFKVPVALTVLAMATLVVPLAMPLLVVRLVDELERRLAPVVGLLERVGRTIGRAVAAAVMLVPAALVVLTWLGQRIVRLDPLRPAGGTAPGWTVRGGPDPLPAHTFAGTSREHVGNSVLSLKRWGAVAVVMVLIGGVSVFTYAKVTDQDLDAVVGLNPPPTLERCIDGAGADVVLDGDPGWPAAFCATQEFGRHGRFDAVTTFRMADYSSEYLNVVDGRRATWSPPDCGECRRIRVWLFGGSAGFGWWQRDDFTVGSQLARTAWREGIALDVTTVAMPGWSVGQEVRRFADLSVRDRPPDVAIFYDGGNDLSLQKFRAGKGRGDDESQVSFAEDEIDQVLRAGPFAGDPPPESTGPILQETPEQVAVHAMNRYRLDLELARRIATAFDVEPIFAWQPLQITAPLSISDPASLAPSEVGYWRSMMDTATPLLPDDVIDLSDVFDDTDRLVFKDMFHTNEYGSAVAAQALFEQIEDQLRSVAR